MTEPGSESFAWSEVAQEPRNVDRIRRRAHAVLEGRVPARPPPIELALVTAFTVATLVWGVQSVVVLG
jgi:hypothetical protein